MRPTSLMPCRARTRRTPQGGKDTVFQDRLGIGGLGREAWCWTAWSVSHYCADARCRAAVNGGAQGTVTEQVAVGKPVGGGVVLGVWRTRLLRVDRDVVVTVRVRGIDGTQSRLYFIAKIATG
jgi:hypothetical protein